MTRYDTYAHLIAARTIGELGLKNQQLLGKCLEYGQFFDAAQFQKIDRHLSWLFTYHLKQASASRYRWHTQGDDKVRSSHAANHGKIFSSDDPPPTGNPGEDFNCRCWAEPLNGEVYVQQTLISAINDNPKKWTNKDFFDHYRGRSGKGVTLQETGYLGDVIEHYSETLGVYDRVNQQIIDAGIEVGSGDFTYDFNSTYTFGRTLDLLLGNGFFSLGESTVRGKFEGDVRKEADYFVINGIITYTFYDEFTDPFVFVETVDSIPWFGREEAVELVGDAADATGVLYTITDEWKTKFNATVNQNADENKHL